MRLSYPHIALHIPRILLPRPDVTLEPWAVIACDQHTSSPEYWQEVEEFVSDRPSTLHAVLPEVYLGAADRRRRIERINWQMRHYLEDGLLEPQSAGFVLVNRRTAHVDSRKGLLVCLDLEHYNYEAGTETLIRPTEGTDPERLPPRVEVRRDAPLELPHILVLIDDPERTVIEPLFAVRNRLPLLYDFELMMGGGHIQGWHVGDLKRIAAVVDGLSDLAADMARYGESGVGTSMLYAMGDGNHSFATAYKVWQEAKRRGVPADHPSRYALVELVNLHDESLQFRPIHRVLFETEAQQLLLSLSNYCRVRGADLEVVDFENRQQWEKARADLGEDAQHLPFITDDRCGIATIHKSKQHLAVTLLQDFLNDAGKECQSGIGRVDYIHGSATVDELGTRPGNIGFYTEVIDKQSLFRTILLDGSLPRKAFSLGEAEEKRYYLESRLITN